MNVLVAKDPRWIDNCSGNCHKWCRVFCSLQIDKTPDTRGGDIYNQFYIFSSKLLLINL